MTAAGVDVAVIKLCAPSALPQARRGISAFNVLELQAAQCYKFFSVQTGTLHVFFQPHDS